MKSNEFSKEFNEKIKYLNLEELKDVINNVIRKIPETRYDETLSIFDKKVNAINENDIKNRLKNFKEKFINLYHKKYVRRSSFRQELNNYS